MSKVYLTCPCGYGFELPLSMVPTNHQREMSCNSCGTLLKIRQNLQLGGINIVAYPTDGPLVRYTISVQASQALPSPTRCHKKECFCTAWSFQEGHDVCGACGHGPGYHSGAEENAAVICKECGHYRHPGSGVTEDCPSCEVKQLRRDLGVAHLIGTLGQLGHGADDALARKCSLCGDNPPHPGRIHCLECLEQKEDEARVARPAQHCACGAKVKPNYNFCPECYRSYQR